MKDDPELELDDTWPNESARSSKRRRVESGKRESLPILLGIVLVLILAGGIVYFLSKGTTGDEATPLESRVTALEQKIVGLEKQLTEFQEKTSVSGPAPVAAQKGERQGKPKQSAAEPKAKPSAPSKAAVSPEKQYHTVQKGETLSRISKKYGISAEELRKLNNLSADKPIRVGQRLLVSRGR
ncbi:MAG: LysM peptidoglycan-binding domain-containing protein [Deltaproteobacteria bacterium]